MEEHKSNYEYKCSECGQPINPQTPYRIRKRYETFQANRITTFDRVHVECPGVNHEEK